MPIGPEDQPPFRMGPINRVGPIVELINRGQTTGRRHREYRSLIGHPAEKRGAIKPTIRSHRQLALGGGALGRSGGAGKRNQGGKLTC